MPNLLAMSFEGELAPSFDLVCLRPGHKLPDGWGIGYYPGGEPSASVLKEPAPPQGSIRSELVKAWEHLESSLFVLHVRSATWGSVNDANTQPFSRSWGGRDWLIAHSGSLRERLSLGDKPLFEPVGSTDTELIFCMLLGWLAEQGIRSLGDIDPGALRDWFAAMNDHGGLTSVLTDGRDLVVYADRRGDGDAYLWKVQPPYERLSFSDEDLVVDLSSRGVPTRKGVIVSSDPLEPIGLKGEWQRVPPGHLLVVRQGAITAEVASATPDRGSTRPAVISRRMVQRPTSAEVQRYDVVHRTAYRYTTPVERSAHLFRVTPVHDRLQNLQKYELKISVEGQQRDYEDVFGNRARKLVIDNPFDELVIEARSRVELYDTDPLSFRPLHARSMIPLVWMPWQRQVLQPYLLPPELPESELAELIDYAMTFVERNDYDLLDTLLDINHTIYTEYTYKQGATNLFTTAFDVYANRLGVCQDFTNLFICLARLLGVPARYVCGYIYTGPKHENQRQA
ncbi:MAG TPA: class II glutamine amidotransferase, partial [Candidatus Nanopelagicales bacterium]|nr:class II glutamine amidotransferase [Candidatus Nanopelagicales bacterium]